MALSSAGIGSNLPIDDMVTKLMAVESRPLQMLSAKEATFQSQISAFGQVKGALSSLQTAARALQDGSKFNSIQASSSADDRVKVSGSSTAGTGNYLVRVESLAQSQKLATAAFASTTAQIGGGTLTFRFGTTDTTPDPDTFTINPDKPSQSVTIPAGSTLVGIRDAVNKANIGVTASIVNDGSGNKLVFTTATGTKSTLKIESGDAGLQAFTHDPAGVSNLTQVQAAQDAKFKLDGMPIVKQSNTVTDAVEGLTFTLQKVHEASDPDAKVDVTRSSSGVQKAIQDFVKGFNDLQKALDAVSKVDTSSAPSKGTQRQAPALAGDVSIRSIRNQLRAVFFAEQSVDGVYKRPAEIGLAFDKDGNLALDANKLQKAIDSNPTDVQKLFGSVGTPTDSNIKFSSATGNTKTGNYAINLSAVQNGTKIGETILPDSIDVAIQSGGFSVNIDGENSNQLTLPANIYSPSSLANQLQGLINADSKLSAKGITVSVAVDSSGKLLISSNKTGVNSSVAITGLNNVSLNTVPPTNIALFVDGAGTTGAEKVSGTIGGYPALGEGNKLTGAVGTPVEGLAISVSGGTIGERGTIEFTKGFAFALDGAISGMLTSKSGIIDSRVDGLNRSVKNLGTQRERLNDRLTQIEARYRKQFNTLDSVVSQFQSTGNYLSQQLASLSKSS